MSLLDGLACMIHLTIILAWNREYIICVADDFHAGE